MMFLKRIIAKLPERIQLECKRFHHYRQIKNNNFTTQEPEYLLLPDFIGSGDWVIDIGANIGKYTLYMSELVGNSGRVISFEPIPETFSILSSNVLCSKNSNITLINAAASDKLELHAMTIPNFDSGLTNYYRASISSSKEYGPCILCIPVDSIVASKRIALVKIDAEGHESHVLYGMKQILYNSKPILIVETSSKELTEWLLSLGYTMERDL